MTDREREIRAELYPKHIKGVAELFAILDEERRGRAEDQCVYHEEALAENERHAAACDRADSAQVAIAAERQRIREALQGYVEHPHNICLGDMRAERLGKPVSGGAVPWADIERICGGGEA